MSRTYRRTRGNQGGHRRVWITHSWEYDEHGIFRRVALEGKELKKALARYHSDHDYNSSPSTWWRKNEWSKFRAQAEQQLHRWNKNPDYEVQIRDNARWPWWD